MLEVALNPVSLLISFMSFMAYLYSQTVEVRERSTARAVRARGRVEKNSNKDSIDHSGKSKSNFYRNVKVPGESRISQKSTQGNSMVLRTQTANLGGAGMMQIEQPRPVIQHQRSTNFGGYQSQGAIRRQISFNERPSGMNASLNSSSGNFGAQVSQRAFATQAEGMPPLFVGFLTNDVSMKHVQFMMDTYSKASENVKAKSKSMLRDKIDRAFDKKKRGKFDARFMSSSSEEEMEEEDYSMKKKRKSKRLLGKRKRSHRKSSSMNIQTTVRGKAFNKGEISQDVFKKSFIKVKTNDSEGLKTTQVEEKQPESPKFASNLKVTKTEQSSSLFENNIGKTVESKKEETKTSQQGTVGGLFSNITQKAEEKKTEPAQSGGLFTITELKEEVVQNKKTDEAGPTSCMFGGNVPAAGGSGGLFSNNVETKTEQKKEEKKEEIKTTTGGGLFDNIATVEKKQEKKEQVTSGGGLFSDFGTAKKEETKTENSGLFTINVQKVSETTENKKEVTMAEPALEKKEASNSNQIGGLFDNATSSNNQGNSNALSSLFSNVQTKEEKIITTTTTSNINANTSSLFENNTQTQGGLFQTETKTKEVTTSSNNTGGIAGLFSDNNNNNSGGNNQNTTSGIGGLFNNTTQDNNNTGNATSTLFSNDAGAGGAQDNPFMNVSATKSKNENNMRSMISQNNTGSLFSENKEGGGGGLFNDGGNKTGSIGIFDQGSGSNNNNQGAQSSNPFANFNTGGSSSGGGIFADNSGGGTGGLFSNGASSGGLFS